MSTYRSLTNTRINPYLTPIPYSAAPEDRTCIICYEEYERFNLIPNIDTDSPARLSPCNHVFGMRCAHIWLRQSSTCPLCRIRIPIQHSRTYAEYLEHLAAQALAHEEAHSSVFDQLRDDPGADMALRNPQSVNFWSSITGSGVSILNWDTSGVPGQEPASASAADAAVADMDPGSGSGLDAETGDDEDADIDVTPSYDELRDWIIYRAFMNTDGPGTASGWSGIVLQRRSRIVTTREHRVGN
ncbi:hypothetical protein H2201_003170 [Coniosporium apollinis]|uniref:RING-type domain-containing protein n=1 Tax=Coniosporium apollinis TaxID=61459 RepID=A0ABQ9NWN0_9PEZI|nr:hypothetical protein H2201_003170 [Coniosporium apollinis]